MSETSDPYVQERPAWLIPGVIGLAIAILSGLFAYYYFGPTPAELLGLDPRASDSQEKIDITIGDQQFLVPANFTRYPLQRAGGTQQQIDLHALLPSLSPYANDRQDEFESNDIDSDVVHLKIHVPGNLLPAARRLEAIYSRHLQSLEADPHPSGMDRYTFAEQSGYRDQDLFVYEEPGSAPILMLCFRESEVIFSPGCTRTLLLSDNVALTYRFKRHHHDNWRTIDQAILTLVNSFSAGPAEGPDLDAELDTPVLRLFNDDEEDLAPESPAEPAPAEDGLAG